MNLKFGLNFGFCCIMHGLSHHAVSVCLSARPSVAFIHSVKTDNYIVRLFSPSGRPSIILVYPYQTRRQCSDGNPPNWGVECRWGRQKSQFWDYIGLHCVLTLWLVRCCQYDAVGLPSRKLWHFAGSKRRCLLMAGKDGEMFMTRSFNVTPKTTEQHLIALTHSLLRLTSWGS